MTEEQFSNADEFSDISTKLRDIEEKQSVLKDRVLLIGDNLVSEKADSDEKFLELKADMLRLEEEIKRLKMTLERIIEATNSFARKNELDILKRQFEMFSPLNLARMSDVKEIVEKALKKKSD